MNRMSKVALGIALCISWGMAAKRPFVCGTPDSPVLLKKGAAKAAAPDSTIKGTIHVIVFRVGFSDKPYKPSTVEKLNEVNKEVSQFMKDNSNGKLNMTFEVYKDIWTAPQTGASYASNMRSFESWVADQVVKTGMKRGEKWDRYVVSFPEIGVGWAGFSYGVWGGDNYINGLYESVVVSHEMGHSIGLYHAASIEAGKDVIGTENTDQLLDYGDPYDVMGSGAIEGHFSVRAKRVLGWLDEQTEVVYPQKSGVYRLYAHDSPTRSGKTLALIIPSGKVIYWVEYRTKLNTRWYNGRKGVSVRLTGYKEQRRTPGQPALLDMQPNSKTGNEAQFDFDDSHLEIGKTYKDKFGGFSMKPIGQNENVWDQNGWIDVELDFGTTGIVSSKRLKQPVLSSPWQPGYRVIDLKNREYHQGEALPRGLYILVPQVNLKEKKNLLYLKH